MNNLKLKNILVPVISSILIVIFSCLNIEWYLKKVIFPFFIVLISNIILVYSNKNINKKAYLLLIPIFLVLVSDLVINIDSSNMFLNIIVLPILLSIFFLSLMNKNYSFSFSNIFLLFKIFPDKVFSNLKFLEAFSSKLKNKKLLNVILGILIALPISIVILILLTSADLYFSEFMDKIFGLFSFDIGNIILFVVWFIILFSIGINIIKSKEIKMIESKYKNIDETIIITILSIVNFIFILFLISEVSKLTNNFLQLPIKYTYASYAREGFFQLLFVTFINFSIIMFFLYKTKSLEKSKVIKYLILLLISFSIILIFNSYYRMFLYIGNYGFTILRLQVILFLAMELIIFILLIKRIVKELNKDVLKYFIVMVFFYIINLYLCSDWFIEILNNIYNKL